MSGQRIRLSAREVLEVLAGRRSLQDMNAAHGWSLPGAPAPPNTIVNPFERHLHDSRLASAVSVIKTDENDSDDWIKIEFGAPDPAITPFK